MLHIILIILKIVGIILALLLLLLLIAILLILLVPIRYRMKAEKDGKIINAEGKLGWLMGIITVIPKYENGKMSIKLKLFGFPKKFKENESKQSKSKTKPLRTRDIEKRGKDLNDDRYTDKDHKTLIETDPEEITTEIKEEPNGFCYHWKNLMEKLKSLWKKIKSIPEKIQKSLKKLFNFKLRMQNLWSLIKTDGMELLRVYKGYLLYLWKHLQPRKINGFIRFGFDDPSITGQLTGIIYILLPSGCKDIQIQPEFGQAVLEGKISLKGYIRGIHILRIGWKVFRDRNLKRFIEQVKA